MCEEVKYLSALCGPVCAVIAFCCMMMMIDTLNDAGSSVGLTWIQPGQCLPASLSHLIVMGPLDYRCTLTRTR